MGINSLVYLANILKRIVSIRVFEAEFFFVAGDCELN